VLTIVVQNAVPMREMGVATSSVTFFRSMGGAIGASALGAVLTARIATEFKVFLPPAVLARGGDQVAQLVQSPSVVDALKRTHPALHEGIIQAYSHGIDRLFLVAIPVSVLSMIAAAFIRQVNLRGSAPTPPAAPARGTTAANGTDTAEGGGAVNGATVTEGGSAVNGAAVTEGGSAVNGAGAADHPETVNGATTAEGATGPATAPPDAAAAPSASPRHT
jgi:hypothetical protein